jgi:hypothetical protein
VVSLGSLIGEQWALAGDVTSVVMPLGCFHKKNEVKGQPVRPLSVRITANWDRSGKI